jgi:hypothetical protein
MPLSIKKPGLDPTSAKVTREGQVQARAAAQDAEILPPPAPPPVPDPKKVLAEHPELARQLGDLAGHVEMSLLDLLCGKNGAVREAMKGQLDAMRTEPGLAEATALEKPLIQRIVLTWLQAHQADLEVAGHIQKEEGGWHLTACSQRRQQQAHQRLISSIKTLATVRRLLRPTPSPVEVASLLAGKTDVPAAIKERLEAVCAGN